jgi:hypothetical protein
MFITGLCGPGIVYIGFSLIQIFIDIYNGVMNAAFLKFIIMIVFTLIINILCDLGFSVIAWILVFIPIIMMTVISTLLLQVFGLDSKNKNITSKKISGDISETETVNSEQTNAINNDRIDRDKLRIKFYDDIDHRYNLSQNNEDKYDLSNNPIKYNLVDNVINYFGEYTFVKNIVNSELFNKIFSNALRNNNDLLTNYNTITRESNLEEINLINSFNSFNSFNGLNPNGLNHRSTSNIYGNNGTSDLKYDHLNLNSYDVYKTKAYIDSLNKNDDRFVCPSNETPITYKSKTGLDCYEICPPGKLRNTSGECK